MGGSIGAALKAGTADLASCKLSFCCVAAGVDLSHDVRAKGVHGDEKLRSKEGAVFLATPDEWKAALQARLGAPHHVKDARHIVNRAGVLIADGKLSLLSAHERHGLEAFKDAWLFELPSDHSESAAGKKAQRSSRSPQKRTDGHGPGGGGR